jgi:hypothetical protein
MGFAHTQPDDRGQNRLGRSRLERYLERISRLVDCLCAAEATAIAYYSQSLVQDDFEERLRKHRSPFET